MFFALFPKSFSRAKSAPHTAFRHARGAVEKGASYGKLREKSACRRGCHGFAVDIFGQFRIIDLRHGLAVLGDGVLHLGNRRTHRFVIDVAAGDIALKRQVQENAVHTLGFIRCGDPALRVCRGVGAGHKLCAKHIHAHFAAQQVERGLVGDQESAGGIHVDVCDADRAVGVVGDTVLGRFNHLAVAVVGIHAHIHRQPALIAASVSAATAW